MPIYDWICACGETCDTVHSMLQVGNPENHPKCGKCGVVMKRNFRAEKAGLADSSRNKGIFPYVDDAMGHDPVVVESQQHRRALMKERGLYDKGQSDRSRAILKDRRRFF